MRDRALETWAHGSSSGRDAVSARPRNRQYEVVLGTRRLSPCNAQQPSRRGSLPRRTRSDGDQGGAGALRTGGGVLQVRSVLVRSLTLQGLRTGGKQTVGATR